MGPYTYWLAGNPRYRDFARRSNEAQAAAWVAAFAAVGRGIGNLPAAAKAALAWWRRCRRTAATIQQLTALDDRLLRDIGLSREAIHDAAHNPPERRQVRTPVLDWSQRRGRATPANQEIRMDAASGRDAA